MSRILIIDDEPSNRLILQSRLRDMGHEAAIAENGAQGLHEAREHGWDLFVVADALSSGVDAWEVCRRLKGSPETAAMPVLIFGRQAAQRDSIQKAFSAGCDSYVTKAEHPVLEHIVGSLLRRKAQRDDLGRQMRALEDQIRRLQDERGQPAGTSEGIGADVAQMIREVGSGAPDGLIIVDAEGVVRMADRGAHDILGNRIEGMHLGRLAAGTGLEAFVRDAHTEPRSGFRFEVKSSGSRLHRTLNAAVVPLVAAPGETESGLRIVLLIDIGRRRVVAELMQLQESGNGQRELAGLRETAREHCGPASLVGTSEHVAQLRSLVASASALSNPVLIQGEPGVGKKHVARALHYSGGAGGPFICVRCGALSGEDLESELFGHVQGAYPGAAFDQPGVFQQANDGSVVLEDVEALPLELQQRLVAAITDRVVRRAGSQRTEAVDVRVLATTTVDLEALVASRAFDAGLYELISGLVIEIEPLRDRGEDVPVLAQHFLERYGASHEELEIQDEAMYVLDMYGWPGNVREFATAVERACTACPSTAIEVEHLPQPLRDLAAQIEDKQITPSPRRRVSIGGTHTAAGGSNHPASHGRQLREYDITDDDPPSFAVYERKLLLRALEMTGGDKLQAAKLLQVGKSTLYRKLKRHELS